MTILTLVKTIFLPFDSIVVPNDFIGAFSSVPENYGF